MKAIDYVNQIRKTLMSQKAIYPEGRRSDWEILLHYCAANGHDVCPELDETDFPVMLALEGALAEFSPEEFESIAREKFLWPDDNGSSDEVEWIPGVKYNRQQQYKFLARLHLHLELWQVIQAESKCIDITKGLVVKLILRKHFAQAV